MLFSLAIIFITGMLLAKVFSLLKLPSLLGMLIAGIILGPSVFNLLDHQILGISLELRELALIIILTRAGLNLDIDQLKKAGKSTLLMCFVPAIFEIVCITITAPILLGFSYLEAMLLGSVLAAVSPAVIVPKMLQLQEEGYGKDKSIPQIVMACASVDDVFVLILFSALLQSFASNTIDATTFLQVPSSILLGLLGGFIVGLLVIKLFKKVSIKDSSKVIILLSISFVAVSLEDSISGNIAFSGLLFIMALGATINLKYSVLSKRLSTKFSKLWIPAQILLFVLVGASVDIQYLSNVGIEVFALLILALVARSLGVYFSLYSSNLNKKEKYFMIISYLPKATVQAAIGGIPLANGIGVGNTVLTVAVLSILVTAPLGSILIDNTYKKYLYINN